MCLAPVTLVREREEWQDQNTTSTATRVVPCGKCPDCLKRKQKAWAFRLYEEMKVSESAHFLTFTYANAPVSISGRPTLRKRDFQLFMKKLRKHNRNQETKIRQKMRKLGLPVPDYKTLKYYMCGEYGPQTNRPHYHAILFNLAATLPRQKLIDAWAHGHVDFGDVNMASIMYTTKYCIKGSWKPDDQVDQVTGEIFEDDREPEHAYMSKGMGKSYLSPSMVKYHKNRMVSFATLPGGVLTSLPRYYRDTLFDKTEKYIIAEAGAEARQLQWEKTFFAEDPHAQEVIWKKDQYRKLYKAINLEKQKL